MDCIVFAASAVIFALPMAAVRAIVPRPQLWRPPTMPPSLLGVLNLRGEAIPVVRLDRLLGLGPGASGPLVVLHAGWAVTADEVMDAKLGASVQALAQATTFNGCVDGIVSIDGGSAYLLAPERLLAEGETLALLAFRDGAAGRLADWDPATINDAGG